MYFKILAKRLFFFAIPFVMLLSLTATTILQASEPINEETLTRIQSINATYKVKASFFSLPIKARIVLEKFNANRYQATVIIRSPFFDLDQVETVRVSQCDVQLLEMDSQGDRIGVKDWNEKALIEWPNQKVSYYRNDSLFKRYLIEQEPSGFTSIFAHQYVTLMQQESNKVFSAVHSKRGVEGQYINKGRDEKVKTKFYRKDIAADRIVVLRSKLDEKDMPTVWYQPEKLGAFPLKMTMKLGVFTIEAQLKTIDSQESDILAFFDGWGCPPIL